MNLKKLGIGSKVRSWKSGANGMGWPPICHVIAGYVCIYTVCLLLLSWHWVVLLSHEVRRSKERLMWTVPDLYVLSKKQMLDSVSKHVSPFKEWQENVLGTWQVHVNLSGCEGFCSTVTLRGKLCSEKKHYWSC